jgi:hypothetical protein
MEIIEGHGKPISFEIADMVTIPRAEYEELRQKGKAADSMYLEVMQTQHDLSAKLRGIWRMKNND